MPLPAPMPHHPVLAGGVMRLLAHPGPGLVVDATVGAGGHAEAVLEASGPEVALLGIDRDPAALALAADRLARHGERVRLVAGGFAEVAGLAETHGEGRPVVGVLADLGVSSMQLDRPERGFSFRTVGPLDMRMDPGLARTAADLCNELDVGELATLLRTYGEEPHARRIAAAIAAARPLERTDELAAVVAAAVPARERRRERHPATRVFQALRIVVNAELDHLRAFLPQARGLLVPPGAADPGGAGRGGRLAVLAYHSLEDRIVKQAFAEWATGCVCPPDLPVCGCGREPEVRLLTRGAEQADDAEVTANPRARSARLRAVERVAPAAPPPPDVSAQE